MWKFIVEYIETIMFEILHCIVELSNQQTWIRERVNLCVDRVKNSWKSMNEFK